MKVVPLIMLGFLCLILSDGYSQTRPGSIRGIITDSFSKETMAYVKVTVKDESGKNVIKTTPSGVDGKYNINPLMPGVYSVEFSCPNYSTTVFKGVLVHPNVPTLLDANLNLSHGEPQRIERNYKSPIIIKGHSGKGQLKAEDIATVAIRDIMEVATVLRCPTNIQSQEKFEKLYNYNINPSVIIYFQHYCVAFSNIRAKSYCGTTNYYPIPGSGLPAMYGDHICPFEEYDIALREHYER